MTAPPPPEDPYGSTSPSDYGAFPRPTEPEAPWRPDALSLPQGVELASVGRRIGAYFLAIPLSIVTLGIGYLIWGAIVWGKGTSPALQVLGMRVWRENTNSVGTWGTMALRDIVGGIVQGILGLITGLISFIMFLVDDRHRSIPDRIATTIVVYDPNKVIP